MLKWVKDFLAYILVALSILVVVVMLAATVKSPHNRNMAIFKRDCLQANGIFVNAHWDSNGANAGGLKGSMICIDSSALVGPRLFTR